MNSVIENDNQSWCKLALQKNVAYGSCRMSVLTHRVTSCFVVLVLT